MNFYFIKSTSAIFSRQSWQIAGSGRWALKNLQRGYFLGSSQDELKCTAKAPGEAEYWLVHLAARPQVCFKYSVSRFWTRTKQQTVLRNLVGITRTTSLITVFSRTIFSLTISIYFGVKFLHDCTIISLYV